jgi:hypothetical protein
MTANSAPEQTGTATIAISITLLQHFNSSLPQLSRMNKKIVALNSSRLAFVGYPAGRLPVSEERRKYGRNSEATNFSLFWAKTFMKSIKL